MGAELENFWQEEAEKSGIPHLGKVIGELVQGQRQVLRKLDDMETEQKKIAAAFPDQDFEGHRRYHQTLIEKVEETRKLRKAIQEKTISGLIWSALVWGATMVWTHLPKIWER